MNATRPCAHCGGLGHVPAPLAELWVPGTPRAKGSPEIVRLRGGPRAGKPIVREDPVTTAWEASVRKLARYYGRPVDAPVAVELGFVLPRVRTVRGRDELELAAVPPDIDKLSRAVLDGLQRVLFRNDSRVTRLLALKRAARTYAPTEAGVRIGVRLDRLVTSLPLE